MPEWDCFPQLWLVIFVTSFLLSRHRLPLPILHTIGHRMERRFRPRRSHTWPARRTRGDPGEAASPSPSPASRGGTHPGGGWEEGLGGHVPISGAHALFIDRTDLQHAR